MNKNKQRQFYYKEEYGTNDSECKVKREKIIKKIKENYEQLFYNNVLRDRTQFCKENWGISESTLRNQLDGNPKSIKENALLIMYQIYISDEQNSLDEFSSIFEEEELVKNYISSKTMDKNQQDAGCLSTESEKKISEDVDKINEYVSKAVHHDFDIQKEYGDIWYEKYEYRRHIEEGNDLFALIENFLEIELLYIVRVDKDISNVKKIIEGKKNEDKSLIWIIYMERDKEIIEETEKYLETCKKIGDYMIISSVAYDKNLCILYNPWETDIQDFFAPEFSIETRIIIHEKKKKTGKKKNKFEILDIYERCK